jgi:hypothetical protein
MSFEAISNSITRSEGRLRGPSSLSLRDSQVYDYIRDLVGTTRVPVHVPLYIIAFKLDVEVYKVRYVMHKLVKRGYIERFTAYGTNIKTKRIYKKGYYRLPKNSEKKP